MLKTAAGPEGNYLSGQKYDLNTKTAKAFIAEGAAVSDEPPKSKGPKAETATAVPETETATVNPNIKTRAKAEAEAKAKKNK